MDTSSLKTSSESPQPMPISIDSPQFEEDSYLPQRLSDTQVSSKLDLQEVIIRLARLETMQRNMQKTLEQLTSAVKDLSVNSSKQQSGRGPGLPKESEMTRNFFTKNSQRYQEVSPSKVSQPGVPRTSSYCKTTRTSQFTSSQIWKLIRLIKLWNGLGLFDVYLQNYGLGEPNDGRHERLVKSGIKLRSHLLRGLGLLDQNSAHIVQEMGCLPILHIVKTFPRHQ